MTARYRIDLGTAKPAELAAKIWESFEGVGG